MIGIAIKGFRLDKRGKLVKDKKKLDVCARIKQRSSQRIRVAKKGS